ncbi:MAG: cysteine--tRNA ligase [Planctomycetota bacterium]|nr:cysteine--tRNA ligase [Planctomycetota bacterium]
MLKVHNTLGNKLEEFKPVTEGKVRMYVCGVTVYDTVHVGHARCYVNFDTIRRYLEFLGYEVTFVQNFTDIDDKIINRAHSEGRDWKELTRIYEAEYFRLMDCLGIRRATRYPRATEHIAQMIDMTKALIEKGHAYVTDGGDVYFDVSTFEDYGSLINRERLENEGVCRVAHGEKRNKADFALWKAAKPDEPHWSSPWGEGRPGWHIECSAMSREYLGDTFDIHGGGQDLVFPHHTNEIAQSECCTCQTMARYWIHNGFIQISGEKMSKSLDNFVTLEDAIEEHGSGAMRMFFLLKHYRSPLNFDVEQVQEARAALGRFEDAIGDAQTVLEHVGDREEELTKSGRKLRGALDSLDDDFRAAMNEDFNTPSALAVLYEFAQKLFGYVRGCAAANAKGVSSGLLSDSVNALSKYLGVFGFAPTERDYDAEKLAEELKSTGHSLTGGDALEAALKLRDALRADKRYDEADEVRNIIEKSCGISVKDWPFGSRAPRMQFEASQK